MPKVSVIVPMFCAEKYINRCIQSLKNQTEKEIEVLLVDDHSLDNTIEFAQSAIGADSRFSIIMHKTNKGAMTARKTGYLMAKGDYITFCDADDFLPDYSIELLYSTAIHSHADVISGNITRIKATGKQLEMCWKLNYGNTRIGVFKSLLREEMGHNLCSKLFSRSLLQDYSYESYDNYSNGEDALLFYQIVNNIKKMVHIDSMVYYYWDNELSSSRVRLGHQAIQNIINTNKIRYDICKEYPVLDDDLHRKIILSINELYKNGYNSDGYLEQCLRENSLFPFSSARMMIRYFPISTCISLFLKRRIIPFFRNNED